MSDQTQTPPPGAIRWLWRSLIRPVLAWLGASVVSAAALCLAGLVAAILTENAPSQEEMLEIASGVVTIVLFVAVFILALSAIPWFLITWSHRVLRTRRGWADTLLGGLTGAGLIQLFLQPNELETTDLAQWLTITAVFLVAGLVAGWTYWQLAGRPDRHRG